MMTPRRQWPMPTRGLDFSLAQVTEAEGRLIVKQSNGAALRNFWNTCAAILGSGGFFFVYYSLFPEAITSWFRSMSASGSPAGPMAFLCLPFMVMVFQSANRLFGRETFIFDRNEGVFIRNGYTVGSLRQIRKVTAQVTGAGQYPIFRLILELPRCEAVTIIRTEDLPADGGFCLSGNVFSNPDKRFSMFMPWLDYEAQNLVPFLPQEIVDLRRRITGFLSD